MLCCVLQCMTLLHGHCLCDQLNTTACMSCNGTLKCDALMLSTAPLPCCQVSTGRPYKHLMMHVASSSVHGFLAHCCHRNGKQYNHTALQLIVRFVQGTFELIGLLVLHARQSHYATPLKLLPQYSRLFNSCLLQTNLLCNLHRRCWTQSSLCRQHSEMPLGMLKAPLPESGLPGILSMLSTETSTSLLH